MHNVRFPLVTIIAQNKAPRARPNREGSVHSFGQNIWFDRCVVDVDGVNTSLALVCDSKLVKVARDIAAVERSITRNEC